ncbi:ABC-2 type transport system ATP-binding protein [Streptomyces sp. Amel2xB2]|uniref:ATP-binding cassette domain-containing protein n=1 Tax=Streptomyces sp. Amel2xB2 TaxID=1305829 RepID=UPI000DB93989|nr:ATP-binding cassette domain-containing protein [Streptomyces sp. Amel2xB2]RAJ63380.1 ABC-2 type transport system ATP-binding protein [Streptomyces sp. Amel2xB2]
MPTTDTTGPHASTGTDAGPGPGPDPAPDANGAARTTAVPAPASGTADAPAVETHGLVKVFGDNRAVDGIDLRVPAGAVYGVLGPNGAGKTTAVRMLATLLRPDGGRARVFGHDVLREPAAVRARVSLTGQYASLDEDLTGTENLVLLSRLLGHTRSAARGRAAALLEAFGLADAARRQVKHYSGGMRRRIDIAASILGTPDLLFLDEPTTGLDPRSRNQVWDIVRAVVARGTTVLLTTQYLDEADQLADRIAVIDHGRVIAEGTPGQLKSSVGAGSVQLRLHDPAQRAEAHRVLARTLAARVERSESDPVALTARVPGDGGGRGGAEQAARALAELTRHGIAVGHFSLGQPSLDEVFLALTDRPAPGTDAVHGADGAAVATAGGSDETAERTGDQATAESDDETDDETNEAEEPTR